MEVMEEEGEKKKREGMDEWSREKDETTSQVHSGRLGKSKLFSPSPPFPVSQLSFASSFSYKLLFTAVHCCPLLSSPFELPLASCQGETTPCTPTEMVGRAQPSSPPNTSELVASSTQAPCAKAAHLS